MSSELSIQVEGKGRNIEAHSLIEMMSLTLKLLEQVESNMTDGVRGDGTSWVISKISRSNPYTITFGKQSDAYDDTASETVRAVITGLRDLDKSARIPKHFNRQTLTTSRGLVQCLNNGVLSFAYDSPGLPRVTPSLNALHNINEISKNYVSGHTEYGCIDGTLLKISVKGREQITITDRVTGNDITCFVSNEQIEESKNLLRKRVTVYGMIKYNKDDEATGIEVEEMIPHKELQSIGEPKRINQLTLSDCINEIREYRNDW